MINKYSIFCFFFSFLISSAVFAQFDPSSLSIGGMVSMTRFFGYSSKVTPGFGLRGAYIVHSKHKVSAGFIYRNPFNYREELPDFNGPRIRNYKVRFMDAFVDYQYALIGDNDSQANLYAGLGFGMTSLHISNDNYLHKGAGYTIDLSLGGQVKAGPGFLFAEAKLGLPANEVNGDYVEPIAPFNVKLNLGYTISLGGGGGNGNKLNYKGSYKNAAVHRYKGNQTIRPFKRIKR